jgi:hypothetical protein
MLAIICRYILYGWSQIIIRTSVLLFYIRTFAVDAAPRRVFWSVLIISDVLGVGLSFLNLFQCTPVSHFWLQWDGEHHGYCIGPSKISLLGGIIDLFWALVVLIVPVLYVLRLKLPFHKKIAATIMFTWGIL